MTSASLLDIGWADNFIAGDLLPVDDSIEITGSFIETLTGTTIGGGIGGRAAISLFVEAEACMGTAFLFGPDGGRH